MTFTDRVYIWANLITAFVRAASYLAVCVSSAIIELDKARPYVEEAWSIIKNWWMSIKSWCVSRRTSNAMSGVASQY